MHTLATFLVAFGTTMSAFWILVLNSWMHTPAGSEMREGVAHATDWWAIVFNPSMPYRLAHMLLASGLTVAFLIAGISALRYLLGDRSAAMRKALNTGIVLGAVLIPIQIFAGDLHGLNTLEHQPAKVAAMEGHWETKSGAPLIVFAFAMFARARRAASVRAAPGQRSTVRSAMLEMILDHDTGEMDGMVLGGTFEGRELQSMSEEELMQLAQEVRDDGESVQLLEAYRDRRMPGWRDDAEPDSGPRQRTAANSGAMTEQEAYQILGLEPGASLAEIRKAHRSLMQRVHPDLGGSSFLAQRINEAKDFLLRLHNERS